MRLLAVFFSVMAVSVVQLYVAGPLGLAWDLNTHAIVAAAFLGGMAGVVAIVFYGPALIDSVTGAVRWLLRRPPKASPEEAEPKPPGRFARLVERFGAPFLGVVGPLTIGGWGAALLGRSMGIAKLPLIAWLAVGQIFVTAIYVYGLAELTS